MGVSKLSAKQPWTATWTPGVNLTNLFALYDSLGDVTINTATSIPTTLDGPIQMVRYGVLTVNAALTASQRCRGLMPLADSLAMGAAGRMGMDARGAAGAKNWAVDRDIFVPQSITFTGRNTSYADFLRWIRKTGYCIFDPSMYACPPPGMGDVQCDWATWQPLGSVIISAAGCGGLTLNSSNSNGVYAGNAGTNGGCGGGATGFAGSYTMSPPGGPGRPWGGGAASAGGLGSSSSGTTQIPPDMYGGIGGSAVTKLPSAPSGGGAGNPGGTGCDGGSPGANGTGGVLFAIVRGNVALTVGHAFTSNGMGGGAAAGGAAGGGSGAGTVGLFYLGTLTGAANLVATGGPAGTGTYPGAPGGLGSTQLKTFAAMGWA